MATITISIPETLRAFVVRQIKTKGFGNVSEYFRALLRQAQERESNAQLETLLMDGLKSGSDIEVTREFWKDLKEEANRLLKKRKSS